MTKKTINTLILFGAVLITGIAQAASFPSVQNLRYEDNLLQWDAVEDAGGYNIYYSGGPSRVNGLTFDYVTTVTNTTSYDFEQYGWYSIVAFDQSATLFSESSSSDNIWIRSNGDVDVTNSDQSTVTHFGISNERYLVENQCSDGSCTASCTAEGNTGFVTGGFCNSDSATTNTSGDTVSYQCDASEPVTTISVGAYCSN